MNCKSDCRFSLEGRFSGFAPHTKKPFKYLRLTTSDGEYCIKLPKYLQLEVVSCFTPGNWIQVVGTWKEKSNGIIRFKAEHLAHAKPTSQQQDTLVINEQMDAIQLAKSVEKPECHPSDSKNTSSKTSNVKILMCGKSKCMKRGGQAVCQQLEMLISDHDLRDRVIIKQTGCMDRCKSGPNLVVMPDKTRYSHVKPESLADLLHRHLEE